MSEGLKDFILSWGWLPVLILGSLLIYIRESPHTSPRVAARLTIPYVILLIIYGAYILFAGLLDPTQGRP